MGGVADTAGNGAIISCVLYQDVIMPANATTASFSFDIGVKGNINGFNNGYKVAVYSTAVVPCFSDAISAPISSVVSATPVAADNGLQSKASTSFNIAAYSNQTVRFAIINATQTNRGEVIGFDNVKFLVNTNSAVPHPTFSEWGMIIFAALLSLSAIITLEEA